MSFGLLNLFLISWLIETKNWLILATVLGVMSSIGDNPGLFTNTNERLVENETAKKTHILLENIELTSKSIEYDPSGDPILETYTFLARDERLVDDSSTIDVSRKLPQTGASNHVIF